MIGSHTHTLVHAHTHTHTSMQENKKGMGELDITPDVLAEMVALIDEGLCVCVLCVF